MTDWTTSDSEASTDKDDGQTDGDNDDTDTDDEQSNTDDNNGSDTKYAGYWLVIGVILGISAIILKSQEESS